MTASKSEVGEMEFEAQREMKYTTKCYACGKEIPVIFAHFNWGFAFCDWCWHEVTLDIES